jgi:transcriptional regulator with XRE-family HTH domain
MAMGKPQREVLPWVAANIKRFRDERGWSGEELAQRAGLSSVKMIEAGKYTGSVKALIAIADALGVSVNDIIADPGAPLPPALGEFLRTPGAAEIKPAEIEFLKGIHARGRRPTTDSYCWALKSLRDMEPAKRVE